MQNYVEISAQTPLLDSLAQLLNNDKTAISCHSGTSYPSANLLAGMLCFREDQNKLYQLQADKATWVEVPNADALISALALKANLASPTFTGTPKAPTAAAGTNTTQIATTAFVKTAVDAAVSALLGDAPVAALDTLKELGDALGNDANFAATMTTALAGKLDLVGGTLTGPLTGTTITATSFVGPLTGNASTATTLATARTINGTSFNGSANITTANWGTARTLTIGSSGKSVNGSDNVSWTLAEIGAAAASHTHAAADITDFASSVMSSLPAGTNGQVLKHNGTTWVAGSDANTTYSAMSQSEADAGTATTGRIITAAVLKGAIQTHAPAPSSETVIGLLPAGTNGQVLKHNGTTWVAGTDNNTTYSAMSQSEAETGTATSNRVITAAVLKAAIAKHAPTPTTITGNAGSATKLATARTLTIGSTGKTFDGSADVSWTLAEIGAAAASHTHSYLPLSGGTLTGAVTLPSAGTSWIVGTGGAGSAIRFPAASAANWHAWLSQKTANGNSFAIGILGDAFYVSYGAKANIDAGTNSTTQVLTVTAGGVSVAGTLRASGGFDGNAATATKLATARTLTIGSAGKTFDGSANVSWTADEILPAGTNGQVLKHNGTSWVAGSDNNTTYSAMTQADAEAGTATAGRLITAAVLKAAIVKHAPTTITGNAGSATKLATARTLTIGSTGKTFDGSGDVSWSLSEIGAAAANHTHSYLPLSGGTVNGSVEVNGSITGRGGGIEVYHSTPHIDFHFGNSTADYTSRLIESASGTLTLQGNFVASGNVTAYSDRRIKECIEPIKEALRKVHQLHGKTYRRKDTGLLQTGLIAQDVQAVMPMAVVEDADEQKTLSINYGSLTGLLVEAIKELDVKLEKALAVIKRQGEIIETLA